MTAHKITDPTILTTLNELHGQANREFPKILKGMSKGILRPLKPKDMKDVHIALTRDQGEYLYDLLLRRKAKNIVEFGTSFGISGIYLGAAARKNGGKVITTEILPNKCAVARENFAAAGLTEEIELREGDAMKTLAANVPDGIDLLLLDGWNDLYLPLLKLLEPKFKPGTLVYTDNASFKSARPLLDYLHADPSKYKSRRLGDQKGGSELSEYLG
ncbi:MAG: class I SAM-dependent methyltransferase [Bacteroidota bacterium]